MGRKEGSTQKKTQECTLNNPQTIHLVQGDIVEHYKVDDRGYIHTNKRGWVRHNATVLIGDHEVKDGEIYTEEEVFSCEILTSTYISSIGKTYAGQAVTVIIHNVE
ncbi:MAG: hypothetical protein ABFD07_17895 [Methanobacterium sp.]